MGYNWPHKKSDLWVFHKIGGQDKASLGEKDGAEGYPMPKKINMEITSTCHLIIQVLE